MAKNLICPGLRTLSKYGQKEYDRIFNYLIEKKGIKNATNKTRFNSGQKEKRAKE